MIPGGNARMGANDGMRDIGVLPVEEVRRFMRIT
jgi:hypothetical protein